MIAAMPQDEELRLAKLLSLRVLDTSPEGEFDDLVQAASALLDAPIAFVSLVDRDRQWFKAKTGVALCETHRDVAFCSHAILQSEPLVVPDTHLDPRFRDNPLVTGEPGARFYAGAPIVVEGLTVGTLCCLDVRPRTPSPRQVEALAALARGAARLLTSRLHTERLAESERRFEAFLDNAPSVAFLKDAEGRFRFVNRGFETMFGPAESVLGLTCHDWLPEAVADAIASDDERARTAGGAIEIEETVPTEGGDRMLRTFKFPFPTEGETWIGGICVDETVLRTAQKKVGEQNEALVLQREELAQALLRAEAATATARSAALRFEQLFAGLPVACYTFDEEETVQEWNSAAEALWGIPAHVAFLRSVYTTAAAFDDLATVRRTMRRVLDGESVLGEERLVTRLDGTKRWLLCNTFPLRNGRGEVVGGMSAQIDVTERRLAESVIREKETRFRTMVDCLHEGVMVQNAEGRTLVFNPSAARILGANIEGSDAHDRRGKDWRLLRADGSEMTPADLPIAVALRTGEAQKEVVMGIEPAGGGVRWLSVTAAPLLREGEEAAQEAVASFIDITERLAQERCIEEQMAQINDYSLVLEMRKLELEDANARLESLATTDGLTGLKNHRFFQDFLRRRIESIEGAGVPLAIALLDVDRFKAYNDEFGHPAGDAVLRGVARALTDAVGDRGLVARYGGEEFVIVMPGVGRDEALALAELARRTIELTAFDLRAVTASFGVACLGGGLSDAAALVKAADEALYTSKAAGRNRVTPWRPAPVLAVA